MRRIVITTCLLLAVAATGWWFIASLNAKVKHDRMRQDLADATYLVVPFDQKASALRSEVETTWACSSDSTDGPDSEVVRTAGLRPCVSNLVYAFNYEVPAFSWVSPGRNREAAVFGLLKAKFFPVSVDKEWHVSDDYHVAMLWCRTNAVFIYRDETNGLRASLYYRKKPVEPGGSANRSRPVRAETSSTSSSAGSAR